MVLIKNYQMKSFSSDFEFRVNNGISNLFLVVAGLKLRVPSISNDTAQSALAIEVVLYFRDKDLF